MRFGNRLVAKVFVPAVCGLLLFSAARAHAAADALALFNPRPTNMEAMGYDGDIVFSLASALETHSHIQLMPRREMEDKLYQEGMVQGDNPELVTAAGRALGVSYVLFGKVTKTGSEISAELKMMRIQSGRIVRTWSRTFAGRDDLLSQMPRLAAEIADIVSGGGAVPATASGVAAGTVSETAGPIDRLQARAEEGRVRIFWEVLPGAPPVREIQVFRSPSEEGPFQLLGPAAENRFVDEQVMPGRTYYYRLAVVQEDGAQVRVPRTVKVRYAGERQAAAPLILGGAAGVRWAEIRFVPSLRNEKDGFSIVRYQVYRKDGQGDEKRIQTVKATPRSQFNPDYTVLDRDGLEDGIRYTYTVAGEDEQGVESRRSDPQAVATAPRPVLTVAQQGLLRRVHFSWEPVTGVDGYRLYRKSGDEAWKRVKTVRGAEKSSATDESGLGDGLTYDYQLTAYDDRGETGPSPAVVAETKPTPPAPEGLAAESGGVKSVQVRWEPVEDPDVKGYAVYRSEGESGSFERIARVTKETAYRDKGSGFTPLKDGVAYTYQVAAYNRYDAEGERAGPVTARTKPRPTPVAALTAALKEGRMVVQWEPGPEDDIQTQILSRSQNQGFWSELEKMPAGRTTFEDADVKSGASYRYRIVVTDADDLQSDASESESVTVP